MATVPAQQPEWASNPEAGDLVEPGSSQKQLGWHLISGVPQKPAYQHFNWWMNIVQQWIQHHQELIRWNGTEVEVGQDLLTAVSFLASQVNIDALATGNIDALTPGGTLNIGDTNADEINIGRVGATVKLLGALVQMVATQTTLSNKTLLLNDGGAAASGGSAGVEVEEDNSVTGYAKSTSARDGWAFKAPARGEARVRAPSVGTSEGSTTLDKAVADLTVASGETHTHFNLSIPSGETYSIAGTLVSKDPEVIGDLEVSGDFEDISERQQLPTVRGSDVTPIIGPVKAASTGLPISATDIGARIPGTLMSVTILSSGTGYDLGSITLNKGSYLIFGKCDVTPGGTTQTFAQMSISATSATHDEPSAVRDRSTNIVNAVKMGTFRYVDVAADNTTYYLVYSQTFTGTAGSATPSQESLYAVRLN